MAYKSVREYIERLEREGELKRITVPLKGGRSDTELDAVRYCAGMSNGPALFLENVQGLNTPSVPLLLNLWGSLSYRRLALILEEEDPEQALRKHMKALTAHESWPKPILVDRDKAVCKEVIIKGDDVDLEKQIPKVWFANERQAYITGGQTVSKDPETGSRNVIWNRYGLLDIDLEGKLLREDIRKRHLTSYIFWNPPASHLGIHFSKAVGMGKPLEVALAVLCDPAIHLAAATSPPYGQDEFGLAGALRDAPVELVKCETVDLEVPATAEWVLEGEVLPNTIQMDGPHLQNCGYIGYTPLPLVRIKCITHREKPLWYATCSDKYNFDHGRFYTFTYRSEMLSELQAKIPEVVDVATYPYGNNFGMTVVKISVDREKRPLGIAQNVICAVWSHSGRYGKMAKYVIVAGPDIDIHSLDDVVWALCTRVQPVSDVMTRKGMPKPADPSAVQMDRVVHQLSEQVGIDATIKIPEKYEEFMETIKEPPDGVEGVKAKLKGIL